jgi:hypothetical protein
MLFSIGHPYTGPYLAHWLREGQANPWIDQAVDPPFAVRRFTEFDTDGEAIQMILHGNWALGEAVVFPGDLCAINQVDGGDEWLMIRRDEPAFESVTFGAFANAEAIQAWLEQVRDC